MNIFFSSPAVDDRIDRFQGDRQGSSNGQSGEQSQSRPEAQPSEDMKVLGADSAASSDGLGASLLCSLDPSVVAMLTAQHGRTSVQHDTELDAALQVCESSAAAHDAGTPVADAYGRAPIRASVQAISGLLAIVTAAKAEQPSTIDTSQAMIGTLRHLFGFG